MRPVAPPRCREARRVVAQDPVQHRGITPRERTRRGRDQRSIKSRHTCHSHPFDPRSNLFRRRWNSKWREYVTKLTGTREGKGWQRSSELLKEEKEPHASDELARRRQRLPWVSRQRRTGRDRKGSALFKRPVRGHSRLLVYHTLFGRTTGQLPALLGDRDGFDRSVVCSLSRRPGCRWRARETAGRQTADGLDVSWASSLGGDFFASFPVPRTTARWRRRIRTAATCWTRGSPSPREGPVAFPWPERR